MIASQQKYSLTIETDVEYVDITRNLEKLLKSTQDYFEVEKTFITTRDIPSSYVLNTILQKEITLYTQYISPLCIILSRNDTREWFLNHFIPVYSSYEKNEVYTIAYCEVEDIFQQIIDYRYTSHEDNLKICNIVNYLKANLYKGNYMELFLDDYYVENKRPYMKYHYIHPSFIYGYNDLLNEFYAIGFDEKNKYGKLKLSYESTREAFLSSILTYDLGTDKPGGFIDKIKIMSVKNNLDGNYFSCKKFLKDIRAYIDSSPKLYAHLPKLDYIPLAYSYGQNAFEHLSTILEIPCEGRQPTKYHNMHIFWEQRRIISRRLEYFVERYLHSTSIFDEINELIMQYRGIVFECDIIRHKYMKILSSKYIDKHALYKELSPRIKKVLCNEYIILSQFCELTELVISEA